MRLILASTSPRRKELLTLLGVRFDIVAPPFVEQVAPNRSAGQQAVEFAVGKAKSCSELFPDALILGSDTLIAGGYTEAVFQARALDSISGNTPLLAQIQLTSPPGRSGSGPGL